MLCKQEMTESLLLLSSVFPCYTTTTAVATFFCRDIAAQKLALLNCSPFRAQRFRRTNEGGGKPF